MFTIPGLFNKKTHTSYIHRSFKLDYNLYDQIKPFPFEHIQTEIIWRRNKYDTSHYSHLRMLIFSYIFSRDFNNVLI